MKWTRTFVPGADLQAERIGQIKKQEDASRKHFLEVELPEILKKEEEAQRYADQEMATLMAQDAREKAAKNAADWRKRIIANAIPLQHTQSELPGVDYKV